MLEQQDQQEQQVVDLELEDTDTFLATVNEMYGSPVEQHNNDDTINAPEDSNDADMDEIEESTPPMAEVKKRKPETDLIKGIRKVFISSSKNKPEPRLPFNAKPAPTTKAAAASFNFGQQVNSAVFGEVSFRQSGQTTTVHNESLPRSLFPRRTAEEKGKQKVAPEEEEEEEEEGEILEASDDEISLENDATDFGALLLRNVPAEEESKALSWIAALGISVSLSERFSDGPLLVLPFSDAEGHELWEERKKAYKGPGNLRAVADIAMARIFGVTATGTGTLGKVTTQSLSKICTRKDEQKVLSRATVSVLGKDSAYSSSDKTTWLVEVNNMDDVRTLLRSPEKRTSNGFLVFSIYTKTEIPELTGVLFNIPGDWSRGMIYKFITQRTGARPIYVTPKRVRDKLDIKYAFIHAESSRHFDALLSLNNIEPIKGRKLKFEKKWTEAERSIAQAQSAQFSRNRDSTREQRQQRTEEEQERRKRRAQDARDRNARLEQEEKQRQSEADRMQKQIRKKLGDFLP